MGADAGDDGGDHGGDYDGGVVEGFIDLVRGVVSLVGSCGVVVGDEMVEGSGLYCPRKTSKSSLFVLEEVA